MSDDESIDSLKEELAENYRALTGQHADALRGDTDVWIEGWMSEIQTWMHGWRSEIEELG